MSVAEAVQTTPQASGSEKPPLLLQRKCACGGSAGFGGACEACKRKMLLGKPLQRKLAINTPGDVYEREADRMAERVMHMPGEPENSNGSYPSIAPIVQRRADSPGMVEIAIAPQLVHEVLMSPGQPLDSATRAFFEPRFGYDFSNVRVHADSKAAESAQALEAMAYTVGNDVVLATEGGYATAMTGKKLLAHELTHVVQQGGAPMHPQVIDVSHPAGVSSTSRSNVGVSPNSLTYTAGPVLQRQSFFENFQSGLSGAFESGTEFIKSSADDAARAALSVLGTPDPSTIMGLIERALHMPGVGEAILSHSALAPHRKQIEQLLVSHGAFEVVGNFIQNPKAHVDQISQSLVPYIAEGQRVAIENSNDLLVQFNIPPEYRDRVSRIMVPLAQMATSAFNFVIEEIILDTVLFWQLRSENQIYDAAWKNYKAGTIDTFDLIVEHIDIVLNVLGRAADLIPLVLSGAGLVAGGAAGGTVGSVVPGAGTAAGSGGGGGVGGGTGLAASEVVGLVLVIAPAAVEGIRGSKAGLELALADQNEEQRQQDSGQIAASIIGLAIMAALAFAPGLALRLGKAIGRKLRQFAPDVVSKLISTASSALERAASKRTDAIEPPTGKHAALGDGGSRHTVETPQREKATSPASGTALEDSVKQSSRKENSDLTEAEKINEVAWVDVHPEVVSGSPGQKKAKIGEHEIVSVPGAGCQRHSGNPMDTLCPLSLIVSDQGSIKNIKSLPTQERPSVEPRRDETLVQPPSIPIPGPLFSDSALPISGSAHVPGRGFSFSPIEPRQPRPDRILPATDSPLLPAETVDQRLQSFIVKAENDLLKGDIDFTNAKTRLEKTLDTHEKEFVGDFSRVRGMATDILSALNDPRRIVEAVNQIRTHLPPNSANITSDAAASYRQAVSALADVRNIPLIVLQPSDSGNVVTLKPGSRLAEFYMVETIPATTVLQPSEAANAAALFGGALTAHVQVEDPFLPVRRFTTKQLDTGVNPGGNMLQSPYLFRDAPFMQHIVGGGAWFLDESALMLGKDHGAITHIIQDLIVESVLKEDYQMTAIEFRKLLSRMDTPEKGASPGSDIWLAT